MAKKNKDEKEDSDSLKKMRDRFGQCAEHESSNRDLWIKNVDMSSSTDQWPQDVVNFRGAGRPRLTINRLNGTCKQIEGDYRQNELAINVLPASYDSDDDIADILAGIIRHIEQVSNAKSVYLHGIRYASRGGWGWVRVLPVYADEGTFEQELRIEAIYNTLTVYCDKKAVKPTREDARFMFVSEMVSRDEHMAEYPDSDLRFTESLEDFDDAFEDWVEDDGEMIRRVEYFTKEQVPTRFALFDNGATVEIESDEELEAMKAIGWKLTKEKTGKRTQIRWQKCIVNQILEERVYKMPFIPLIPFLGEEINTKGKVTLHSAIAYGIDPQLMLNYWKSTATESVCLSPKAPIWGTPKQIQNFEMQWKNVNVNSQPYILYNPDPAAPGIPGRIPMPEQPIGEMSMGGGAERDIAYTTNTFDAQLGAPGQEVSGVALGERQQQGTTGNFLFIDNGKIAIEHIGRVLLSFIPLIYDTERVVRVLSLEGKGGTETINQEIHNPLLGITDILNDITVGSYQVVVEAGKAFATRRKESVDQLLNWAKSFPNQSPLVSDQVLEAMDVPGGTAMAERVRRSLPPQVVNDPDSPEGQQAQAQAQQQQQQAQQMQQQLIQSKMQAEQGKNQASMAKANAEVIRSQAEVVKAKSDVEIAAIDTHNAKMEHAMSIVDHARTGQEAVQPPVGNNPVQSASQPQPAQPQVGSFAGNRQQDVQKADDAKQILGALAQHLMQTGQHHQQQMQGIHELLGHVAQGNQAIGQHMAMQNQIAQAPVEAIRDKMGKITGRRVVMPGA